MGTYEDYLPTLRFRPTLGDLADAVQHLRDQDWVDPERIAVVGRSYGGFAVLSCVSRLPELDWAAAVDWCGPSNLVTFTRSQPPTWRSKVAFLVGDPDTDEEFLISRSPVTYLDQIQAPLFVIQGANDPRVPQAESDQVVERLRARGVEVRYDIYPDEGHSFRQTREPDPGLVLGRRVPARPPAGTPIVDNGYPWCRPASQGSPCQGQSGSSAGAPTAW